VNSCCCGIIYEEGVKLKVMNVVYLLFLFFWYLVFISAKFLQVLGVLKELIAELEEFSWERTNGEETIM
jgi:hypothetical protein